MKLLYYDIAVDKSGEGNGGEDLNKSSENNEHIDIENLAFTEKLEYRWKQLRQLCFKIVEHKYFELFIILMIVLSSIALVRSIGKIKKLTLSIHNSFFYQGHGR